MSVTRDIAELAERHRCAGPLDPPVRDPGVSFATLTERIRQVAAARQAQDETAVRAELRELARTAGMLAELEDLRL